MFFLKSALGFLFILYPSKLKSAQKKKAAYQDFVCIHHTAAWHTCWSNQYKLYIAAAKHHTKREKNHRKSRWTSGKRTDKKVTFRVLFDMCFQYKAELLLSQLLLHVGCRQSFLPLKEGCSSIWSTTTHLSICASSKLFQTTLLVILTHKTKTFDISGYKYTEHISDGFWILKLLSLTKFHGNDVPHMQSCYRKQNFRYAQNFSPAQLDLVCSFHVIFIEPLPQFLP